MENKNREKSPAAALLLSFVPGLGAIYNGELLKGFSFIGIFVFFIYLLDSNLPEFEEVFVALAFTGFYLYTIIDSYKVALNYNKNSKETGISKKEETKNELTSAPDPILASIVLFFGFLFLFINFDIISWKSVRIYWPLALIILGIKIIYSYLKEDKNEEKN